MPCRPFELYGPSELHSTSDASAFDFDFSVAYVKESDSDGKGGGQDKEHSSIPPHYLKMMHKHCQR